MQSMKNIGTGIGKRRCDVCVVDGRVRVLERRQYPNTAEDAGLNITPNIRLPASRIARGRGSGKAWGLPVRCRQGADPGME